MQFTDTFKIKTDNIPAESTVKSQEHIKSFKEFLSQNSIYDIQLVPMNDFADIYMKVVRLFETTELDFTNLFNIYCEYQLAGSCREVKEVRHVLLGGEDPAFFKD